MVVLAAAAGAVLAMVFSALGAASPEPSDHPLGAWGGAVELVLLPFCLPVLLLYGYLVSPIFWWALPYEHFGRLEEWLQGFVAYPAFQGVLYGAIVWLCAGAFRRFRNG